MRHSKSSLSRILAPVVQMTLTASLLFASVAHSASLKVAFIGDQGVGEHAESVLSLIASEGTDLLLIQGDLGYKENTANTWEAHLNNHLGSDFPVLTLVGNHENFEWPLYQRLIQRRIDRISGLSCSGNTGVKAKCQYGNVEVVQVAPGISEVSGISADDGYADFIRSSFAGSSDRWRICSWHKPHRMMQTGSKNGPSQWDTYDACLDAGAMIALAHEHAYSRTYLLSDFSQQTVVHTGSEMALQPGQSFAFVSGLGGREVRSQARGGDYFASIYTADQGAKAGALFCDFEDKTADCYFKAINGAVPDQFSLTRSGSASQDAQTEPVSAPPPTISEIPSGNSDGYVFSRSDKTEYRWIARNANGEMGSTWIDQSCAAALGGSTATGDWGDLMRHAPAFDTLDYPCNNTTTATSSSDSTTGNDSTNGFVFSRTDKTEYRWIDRNASGELGSIWIDRACADDMGGVSESGDWKDLMNRAPGFDTIASPCY
ncbi:metallophosphoesterase [Granulosicoccus sp. 3-233]|uniref:metallophosphoesterase n=1 Tax=Granulosicoccus sp. 3-233 TaxID=3417969 RepID=UPI003D338F30